MLDAHNAERAQTGASPLTWSADLATKAQAAADGCQLQVSGFTCCLAYRPCDMQSPLQSPLLNPQGSLLLPPAMPAHLDTPLTAATVASQPLQPSGSGYGENQAAGTGWKTCAAAIPLWTGGKSQYNAGGGQPPEGALAWTQIVWKARGATVPMHHADLAVWMG